MAWRSGVISILFFRYYDKTQLCILLNLKSRAPFLPEMKYVVISRECISQLLSKIFDIRVKRFYTLSKIVRHINVKRLPKIYSKFSTLLCFNLGKKKKRTLTVCQLISTIVVALRSDEKEFFESQAKKYSLWLEIMKSVSMHVCR